MKKRCSKCGLEKSTQEFPFDKRWNKLDYWCKGCHKEFNVYWRVNNKEKINKYREENLEKYLEGKRQKEKRRCNTPKGRLNMRMGRSIRHSLGANKKGYHWESLVGYTVEQLKRHFEKQFLPGMTWNNYGLWHIDHKIPISAFNFEKSEDIDFKKCWSLKNLRPLWAKDNISKSNKLNKPFQPSLKLGT